MEKDLKVVSREISYGYLNRRKIPGYLLEDGTVLLDDEIDEQGRYIGGAGMDGMYLRTDNLYTPIYDSNGKICAFHKEPDHEKDIIVPER
ncbi:hypothetical protein AR437_13065 [Christensenella hongkongensis]|uniref:hypothetical protein n=1 Tax=Christensenella hongkongensis TaxID=270498 RepID=UPI000740151B|nr:hypothetical protein [Christensenella hongkongensis]KUJ24717.1 hypothetical protein AR437_13065 [Christensenella hongkongensis]